ncbi:MAG: helix-turn-helix domain-containing protein [Oscillospiraceae bacterium]|nr:helix-turn-helix domain-containing protein [Oscillospiraceae bacterium]
MSNLSERLKTLRKSRKLTQKQVAKDIGISERGYQRYEANEKPLYDVLIALADYFNVSIDYLVGRSDNPKRR